MAVMKYMGVKDGLLLELRDLKMTWNMWADDCEAQGS
jgi:hypothetical protein